MLIRFNPKKLQPPTNGSYFLDAIHIPVGVSTVDDSIKNHRKFQKLVDCEAIQILKDKKGSKKEISLSELTIAEARPLINEMQDKATLEKLKTGEERKTLVEIIDDRIQDLEAS